MHGDRALRYVFIAQATFRSIFRESSLATRLIYSEYTRTKREEIISNLPSQRVSFIESIFNPVFSCFSTFLFFELPVADMSLVSGFPSPKISSGLAHQKHKLPLQNTEEKTLHGG